MYTMSASATPACGRPAAVSSMRTATTGFFDGGRLPVSGLIAGFGLAGLLDGGEDEEGVVVVAPRFAGGAAVLLLVHDANAVTDSAAVAAATSRRHLLIATSRSSVTPAVGVGTRLPERKALL
jgi:hypothetical protein